MYDLFEQTAGRSLTLPIHLEQTIVYIEVDIQPVPSVICEGMRLRSFEDELNVVALNNHGAMDPIFKGIIKLPLLDKILHVLLLILSDNYPYLSPGMKMVGFAIFLGSDDTQTVRRNY